jgi:hypothetical protein
VAPASASAASLKVKAPAHLHDGQVYSIETVGSFKQSELTGTAFFLAFLQFSWAPCKPTAQQEDALPHFRLYFRGPEKHSPFTETTRFTAGGSGERRACSYLYPKVIRRNDPGRPIATATAKYETSLR